MVHPRHDRRRRLRSMRGFTLVELITAASLMTLMMVGVVQIFAIITETASQAQGNAYAMEQGRALMDTIHRDLRGFDRNGYFKIQKWDTKVDGTTQSSTPVVSPPATRPDPGIPIFNGTNVVTWYAADCLALTSVNFYEGQKGDNPRRKTTGAEVVYSANVLTPTRRFEVTAGGQNVDPRRGILARGTWLIGQGGAGLTGTGQDDSDGSAAVTLSDFAANRKSDRLTLKPAATYVSPIAVTPLSSAAGWSSVSGNVWQLSRVATCCTSEFRVEALNVLLTGALPAPPISPWDRKEVSVAPLSGTGGAGYECPRAIRVTVAIHDPNDKAPKTGPSRRYEGFGLQEVFWISDP